MVNPTIPLDRGSGRKSFIPLPTFISVPIPEFELGTDLWLNFHGATIPTSIKVRVYDPDKGAWFYRVALSGAWHKADEFSPRSGEAA